MASLALASVSTSSATTQTTSASKAAETSTETTNSNAAVLKPDTVKLSVAAQAKMMHQQGESPTLIAATLGTDVSSVDGYLGIKVAAAAVTTTPASSAQSEPAETSTATSPAAATTQTAQPATASVETAAESAAPATNS